MNSTNKILLGNTKSETLAEMEEENNKDTLYYPDFHFDKPNPVLYHSGMQKGLTI
jgi:hypothetical protein